MHYPNVYSGERPGMETANQPWRFRMVSVVIVVVLGLQLFAVVVRSFKGWPFIDYPMYAHSYEEGDRIPVDSRLYATLADGTEVPITPEDLGLGNSWWIYSYWIVQGLQGQPNKNALKGYLRSTFTDSDEPSSWQVGDRKSPERVLAFVLARYDHLYHTKIVKLRLEDYGVIVTRHGMERVPPQDLWSWTQLSDDGGDK
jgi:hypothetical protein